MDKQCGSSGYDAGMLPHLDSPVDAQRFSQDGYTVIHELADAACLASLRTAYDAIIAGEVDCGISDRHLGGLTRQVMHPSTYHPTFAHNTALTQAKKIAQELMGWDDPMLHFDMLINKTPGNLNSTPWHQDAAYGGMPVAEAGQRLQRKTLQFWVALDDVDEQNGCMHFACGQYIDELLPHYIFSGDPTDEGRLLALREGTRVEQIVSCPVQAGGATIHLEGTLHMTTPNVTSDRQRRAYIFNLSNRGSGYFDD